MGCDVFSLEIDEILIGQNLPEANVGHSYAFPAEGNDPHQLRHIVNLAIGLKILLNTPNDTWKSFFYLSARSSSKLTMTSTSSSKKEHLRYAL